MKTYCVTIPFKGHLIYTVKAESEEEAIEKARAGDGHFDEEGYDGEDTREEPTAEETEE